MHFITTEKVAINIDNVLGVCYRPSKGLEIVNNSGKSMNIPCTPEEAKEIISKIVDRQKEVDEQSDPANFYNKMKSAFEPKFAPSKQSFSERVEEKLKTSSRGNVLVDQSDTNFVTVRNDKQDK